MVLQLGLLAAVMMLLLVCWVELLLLMRMRILGAAIRTDGSLINQQQMLRRGLSGRIDSVLVVDRPLLLLLLLLGHPGAVRVRRGRPPHRGRQVARG